MALVLPLESAAFRPAAEAVAAGYGAAARAAGLPVITIAHGDDGVLAAFARARAAGAKVIVGPLLRDDVKTLADGERDLPWTIALNQPDEGVALPPRVYTLTLAIEGEGRQIARWMQEAGAQAVAIVTDGSALQRRFAIGFTAEWILQGGGRPFSFSIARDPEGLARLRREIATVQPDAVLLAADARDAAVAKPYLPQVPVYASSLINDRLPVETLRDLDDIRFVEIPWLVERESELLADLPQRNWPSAALDRLYALGFDAFEVARRFDRGAPARLELSGATGRLSLDDQRQIVREGRQVRFRDGSIVAWERRP